MDSPQVALPPTVREALAIAIVKRRRDAREVAAANDRAAALESSFKKLKSCALTITAIARKKLDELPIKKAGKMRELQGDLAVLNQILQEMPSIEANDAAAAPAPLTSSPKLRPLLSPCQQQQQQQQQTLHDDSTACAAAAQSRIRALQRLLRGVQLTQLVVCEPSALDAWCDRPPHSALTAFLQDTLAVMPPSELRQAYIRQTASALATLLSRRPTCGGAPPLTAVASHTYAAQLSRWLIDCLVPHAVPAAADTRHVPNTLPSGAATPACPVPPSIVATAAGLAPLTNATVEGHSFRDTCLATTQSAAACLVGRSGRGADESAGGMAHGTDRVVAHSIMCEFLSFPFWVQHLLAACSARIHTATEMMVSAASAAANADGDRPLGERRLRPAECLRLAMSTMKMAVQLFEVQDQCTASMSQWCHGPPAGSPSAVAEDDDGGGSSDFLESAVARLLQAFELLPRVRPCFPLFAEALTDVLAGLGGTLQHVAAAADGSGVPLGRRDVCRRACSVVKVALMPFADGATG